ncbi:MULTISPECIES: gliding motility-associated C-terminal domain-containing protein [Sphingobacterium]|uniref:gliding motility-associated C-terminal domain-containing protein n=1 Tax=Sphingobacterium TaxID=28453 RepID=UPI0013DD7A0F|nr:MULTISPECIES: gliding motility-associated C-terminal domain-containing protein [unclassified Sphingobacterium]
MNMKLNMLLLVGLFFWTNAVLGEGSKDLYPENIKGNRAFLVSQPFERTAFSNQASHYAYALEGETIAVASSAQNVGSGSIILTAPDGKIYQTKSNNVGRIQGFNGSTRAAELAGPRVGYTSFEVPVGIGQSGIWRVEFTSPDTDPFNARLIHPYNLKANEDWVQHKEGSLIAAWDVSIRDVNNARWLSGRVFMSMLQLHLSQESLADAHGGFYGRNYVLTKDGYIYHVDGNGSHGIDFVYFVNNSGILDEHGKVTYKSANQEKLAKFHNPNHEDNNLHITHKMFYNMPDVCMPKESVGCFPGGGSWLFDPKQVVEVKDIAIEWLEGKEGQLSEEGVFLRFETNYSGRYKVIIAAKSEQQCFKERELSVEAKEGVNNFFWDGLDGDGHFVPKGKDYKIGISISLLKGEVHFPYFDMEINPNGILVERMNVDGTTHSDAIMYWDDTDITAGQPSEISRPQENKVGSPSRVDGHRWGTYTPSKYLDNGLSNGGYGAYSYGNERAMDTWTYSVQLLAESEIRISVGTSGGNDGGEAVPPLEQEKRIKLYQGGDVKFDLFTVSGETSVTWKDIEIIDFPLYGDLKVSGGTIVYKVKDIAFYGDDIFSYRLTNERGIQPVVGKVYLEIIKTNPIAQDDFYDVMYNTLDLSQIINNDFVENSYIDKESVRIVDYPQNGILFKDVNGKWLYQSNETYIGKDRLAYQVMDANGNWSNIATVNIIIKGLFIPNTITPNGDAKNDTFQIFGLSNFDQAEVSIMDRFGRVVFASVDYRNDWIVPSNLTSGVYFYIFIGNKSGQKTVIDKGSLMVLANSSFED